MLEPGRQLDALVAEKVMGRGWCQLMHENACVDGKPRKCACGATGFPFEHHPPFSTDIAAAWEVVEKLNLLGRYDLRGEAAAWVLGEDINADEWLVFAEGSSAPHAICIAALKAVGA